LVINFVRRRLSAFIGLVRRQRRAAYAADPQNGWNEFTRILKTAFAELPVNKLDAQAAEPSGYAEELCGFL